ncbi:MAG: 30S ribosomal protein S3 [Defluviitaleaceae bacterium]|nr:30S ribosomal protein S3 [Defluviitaleaceae bacterium]
MGQKVNPHGLRLGINKEWDSVWYAEKDFAKYLLEDHNIRKFIKKYFKDRKPVPVDPKIARITIKRTTNRVKVTLHTASPGIIIGRNGEAIKNLTDAIQKLVDRNPDDYKADVEIQEIKRPELNAQLVAEVIAKDLENRVTFRRAMKQAMTRTMKNGAKGIKTAVSGRLGGADIARTESYHEGTIPLQTLRADIDYGFAEADTTYGKLGVKVWLYKGEVLPGQARQERGDRPFRGERREGAGDYANAKKGKKTQAVPRSNDRKGTAR